MTIRPFFIKAKKLICDIYYLFKPNTIFVYAYMFRNDNGYVNHNWGDDINIFFLEEITNLRVKVFNRSRVFPRIVRKVYCCIGSILDGCYGKKLEIWGSGFISETGHIQVMPHRVYSVRGPLTRQKLLDQGIDCPAVYGDPALLISKYYHPIVEKKYKYGIVPHYVDEANPSIQSFRSRDDVLLISMSNYHDWHEIPDAICSCEMIISSSLHGLIVSDSYGIPNRWVRFSDKLDGGNFKFHDYFQSIHRSVQNPKIIDSTQELETILNDTPMYDRANNIDFKAIHEACPFKKHMHSFVY